MTNETTHDEWVAQRKEGGISACHRVDEEGEFWMARGFGKRRKMLSFDTREDVVAWARENGTFVRRVADLRERDSRNVARRARRAEKRMRKDEADLLAHARRVAARHPHWHEFWDTPQGDRLLTTIANADSTTSREKSA